MLAFDCLVFAKGLIAHVELVRRCLAATRSERSLRVAAKREFFTPYVVAIALD
jgi:hypothetical protein